MTNHDNSRVALMSLRPRFAAALLRGSKSAEVRRRRVRLDDGSLCLVYASSPVRALVGAFRVASTDTGAPEVLWERWGARTALKRAEFDAYLCGCSEAAVILIES